MGEDAAAPPVTRDAFFGGRLVLNQPARGHRSGTDAVLLAAAVPRDFTGLVYDAGAGAGAAGLGVALACPWARVRLIENDPFMARLAADNIAANGLHNRAAVACCDLLSRRDRRLTLPESAQLIVTNPPFHDAGRVRMSPVAARRSAHVMEGGATLADWILACLDLVAEKGILIVVHVAPAVPEILDALDKRAGGVTLLAVYPRADEPAHRVLVRAVKGSRAPFVLAAPLTLHGADGFADKAERLHRGEAALDW